MSSALVSKGFVHHCSKINATASGVKRPRVRPCFLLIYLHCILSPQIRCKKCDKFQQDDTFAGVQNLRMVVLPERT